MSSISTSLCTVTLLSLSVKLYNVTFSAELTEMPVDANVESLTVTNEAPAIASSSSLLVNVEFAMVPFDAETEIGLQLLFVNSVSFT